MNKPVFSSDNAPGEYVLHFWRGLNDNRQARAQLRRAEDLISIVITPAYHEFLHGLRPAFAEDERAGKSLNSEYGRLAAAALAGMLARVEQHVPLESAFGSTSAVFMARRKKETETPQISELRFRRLLQAADIETFFPMLRRALPLLNGQVDVPVLANDIWHWADRFRGDRHRRQWAYDYYAALSPSKQAG